MIIITTVGTSLFTNLLKKNVEKCFGVSLGNSEDIKEKIRKGAATKEDLSDINFGGFIDGQLAYEMQVCRNFILKDTNYPDINLNASAEIKSISKIANGKPATVYLLATDTFMSEFAAEKIREALNGRNRLTVKFETDKHKIEDLSIDDPEKFEQAGFENLINAIDNIYENHKKDEIILNISGGYKALIPFLTIYAQIRNLPLMYIYEKSGNLIEIGSLPINFDYLYIEAVKPFLKNYYLKEEKHLGELLTLINKNKLHYEDNFYRSADEKILKKVKSIPKIKHQLAYSLIKNKLIILKNGEVELSFIAEMINKINPGSERGYLMELLLYKYFSTNEKAEIVQDYKTRSDLILQDKSFKKENNGKILLSETKKNKQYPHVIGDIDLTLCKNKTLVLGEIKSFSATCDYRKYIQKEGDYYYQLKARLLSAKKKLNKDDSDSDIELAFFVFKFVINDLNETENFLDSVYFKQVIERLYDLNTDKDIGINNVFKCYGIKIPVEFENEIINFTSLYKGRFDKWIWEEIKINNS